MRGRIQLARKKRHLRIRKKIIGTSQVPRISVFRSNRHLHVQLVDDFNGKSILGCSTLSKRFAGAVQNEKAGKETDAGKKQNKKSKAGILGRVIAEMALEKGIKKVVFDKGGYKYHGRVQALAESARKAGLVF